MPQPAIADRISIVVPSLNQGEFIGQALDSLFSQRYPDLEVIVMDGRSTDSTIDILESYADRLAYWVSKPDRGPAAALNEGFTHSTGSILGVLNADDAHLPGALATIAEAFRSRPEAHVIAGHGRFTDREGTPGVRVVSDAWHLRRFQYGACVLVQPATCFRRDAFERAGGYRESGAVCWDMELWAHMAAAGCRFVTIDAELATFRLHDRSITGRRDLSYARRRDARVVMAESRGRPETNLDRALHHCYRFMKFLRHPARTIGQRLYVRSVLKRWSI